MATPIKLRFELEDGTLIFKNYKENINIPFRNDIVFWEGNNYKVFYRKFIYNLGNSDLDSVICKVKKIDKKF